MAKQSKKGNGPTREDHLQEMRALIEAAQSDESEIPLSAWEYMCRMFPHYSENNRILIAMAWLKRGKKIEDLHDVAGFGQWQDMGCQVKKGAKAIWILAPMIKKADQDDPDSETECFGFRPACVFAYSRNEDESDVEVVDAEKWAQASAKRDEKRQATYNAKTEERAQAKAHYPVKVQEAMNVLGISALEKTMIKSAYRELARAHHPDAGGDLEMMKRVNNAHDTLMEYLNQDKVKAA